MSYEAGLGLAKYPTYKQEAKDTFKFPSIKANDFGQSLERNSLIEGDQVCNVEVQDDTQRGDVVILPDNED